MAEFNPDQRPVSADYTSDSKGFKANTAFADLFGAAGEIGVAAVKIKDQSNVNKIQDEVYREVDQLNDEWGTAASAFETNVSNPNNTQPLPSDLQRYGKSLSDVRKAYLNGSLKDSNYQMRIDSLSRQIRARYPGYRDEIDGIINKTLGLSTANDVRKSLMAQWASEASDVDAETKAFQAQVWQGAKDGTLPPDYMQREASGNPYTRAETRVYMAAKYGQKAQREEELQKYTLLDKSSDAAKKKLVGIAQSDVSRLTSGFWEGAFKIPGVDLSGRSLLDAINSGRLKPPSGNDLNALKSSIDTAFGKVNSELNVMINRPEYNDLSPEQKKAVVEQGMANMNVLKDAIYNGQWGLVNSSKIIQDTTLANDLAAFGQDPDIRAINMAKSFANGSAALDFLFLQNPEMSSKANAAITRIMTGNLFDTSKTSLNQVIQEGNTAAKGGLAPEVIKQTVQNNVQLLLKKDVDIGLASQAAKMLFSEENQAFLGNFTDKSQRQLFDTLVSPRMTERMTELAKDDPQMFTNYRNWTLNAFSALFNQDIATINDLNKFGDNLQIKWDAATGQFKEGILPQAAQRAGQRAAMPGGTAAELYGMWANSEARASMSNLNNYVKRLKPIIEAEGGTVEDAMTALFESFGVNKSQNQGSLFTRLYQAMATGNVDPKTGKPNEVGGRFPTKSQYEKIINEPSAELQEFDLDQSGSGKMTDARPRGIRNNNPGNIEFGDFAKSQGATGEDGRFAKFDTAEQGIRAMGKLLENYQKKGFDTVASMINRWAPATENDTSAYISRVAKAMGVEPDEPFLFQGELATKMINAMIEHENGQNPYVMTDGKNSKETSGIPPAEMGSSFYPSAGETVDAEVIDGKKAIKKTGNRRPGSMGSSTYPTAGDKK